MSLLVVGASHATAPMALLERLAVARPALPQFLTGLAASDYVVEAAALSTCNRVEVYAVVSAFHGGLNDVVAALAGRGDCAPAGLAELLAVNYEQDAVRHVFRVAAGLESLVVGESQILGQLRQAYAAATESGAVGPILHELLQQALRVGKRAHSETGIDQAGQSMVTAALALGQQRSGWSSFAGICALVVGAGSMAALAAATLRRAGAARLLIANRQVDRAQRLAEAYQGEVIGLAESGLVTIPAEVDVAICATAAPHPIVTADSISERSRPLLLIDLAIPRDVATEVSHRPDAILIDVAALADQTQTGSCGPATAGDIAAAEKIVDAEVGSYLAWLQGAQVAPTVAALRERGQEVVGVELRRLAQRLPMLTEAQQAEISLSLHRVVQRLLHQPTVRVRQLASEPGGAAYASALRELFDLDFDLNKVSEGRSRGSLDVVRAREVDPRES